jgi:hypothetical protein
VYDEPGLSHSGGTQESRESGPAGDRPLDRREVDFASHEQISLDGQRVLRLGASG